MSFFFYRVFPSLLILFSFYALPVGVFAEDASETKLQAVFDEAAKSEELSRWLDDRINDSIKHGLDARVGQILRRHPVVKEILSTLKYEMKVEAGLIRATLLSQAGKAMPATGKNDGQHEKLYAILQETAKQLNFSEQAREDAHFFVIRSGQINAFTYSGLPSTFLDLVFFQGLLDALTDSQIKAVVGHEIGHIKAEHVRNQILVISILLATGEFVIPDNMDLAMRSAQIQKLHRKAFHQMARMSRHKYNQPLSEFEKVVLKQYFDIAKRLAKRLKDTSDKASLVQLTKMLGSELQRGESEKAPAVDEMISTALQIDQKKDVQFTQEEIDRILESLDRYSRSCEVSADRYGLLVTSRNDAEMVDVVLGGMEKPEAAMRQVEELSILFEKYPDLKSKIVLAQKTHPAAVWRVAQYREFEKSDVYKVYSDSFLKALDTYIETAKILDEMETFQKRNFSDSRELAEISTEKLKYKEYLWFNSKLAEVLLDLALSDFSNKDKKGKGWFIQLVQFLYDADFRFEGIPDRVSEPGGLLFELKKRLVTNFPKTDPLVVKAIDMLSTFARMNIEFVRDPSTGKQRFIAETGSSFKADLEELSSLMQPKSKDAESAQRNIKTCEDQLMEERP